jgi:hypothetical protein
MIATKSLFLKLLLQVSTNFAEEQNNKKSVVFEEENSAPSCFYKKEKIMKICLQKQFIIFLATTLFFTITMQSTIFIPVAHGELIDKITILEIKKENIKDSKKLEHVLTELALLESVTEKIDALNTQEIYVLKKKLKAINHILWIVEDLIREHESRVKFNNCFILLARLVYFVNDLRAETKRSICLLSHSSLIEEKEYTIYQ